jgi:hypothetical protein
MKTIICKRPRSVKKSSDFMADDYITSPISPPNLLWPHVLRTIVTLCSDESSLADSKFIDIMYEMRACFIVIE